MVHRNAIEVAGAIVAMLLAIGGVVALVVTAPTGRTTFEQALTRMSQFTDEMCECKAGDERCARFVSDEMTRWGNRMAKEYGDRDPPKPDEAEAKQMAAVTERLTKCMIRAMMPLDPAQPDPT